MTDNLTATPLGLRELVNQLNRPGGRGGDLHTIVVEQDWIEALQRVPPLRPDIHTEAYAAMAQEIGGLRLRLAISEGRRAQLEQLIDTDPLCPVLNRRAFERDLRRAINLAKRNNKGGSVLFLDLNGLKQINDTYGHAAGDKAIERVAKMLILSCRNTDQIARLGGDEFAVLMPDTPPSGALIRGERVQQLLSSIPLLIDEQAVPLSAAFGAADFGAADSVEDVLNRADAAMYAHKQRVKSARARQ